MAKCERNDVGSLVLQRVPDTNGGGGNFRLWTTFPGAALRRKLFDAVSCGGSSRHRQYRNDTEDEEGNVKASNDLREKLGEKAKPKQKNVKSEKLSDLLSLADSSPESEVAVETKNKKDALEECKGAVRELQVEDLESRRAGASNVRLLAKEDVEARRTLAMLGAIPPLIEMLDLEDDESQVASLYALLNLGIGNDLNKTAIVKAGAVHKMLKLIDGYENASNPPVSEAIVANFLALSALDLNKPIIGSCGAIPFLVKNLQESENKISSQAKQDALRALYNLSICPSNISFILETDLISFLLNALGDMEVSERILLILSNMVSTPEGRKAISISQDAFPILIDVLNWTDSPGCQEKASYILMVMAHKAFGDRQALIEAGIMSALLELSLLGSTLAQKRASRILECLRVDKGKHVSENSGFNLGTNVSAPICGSPLSSLNPNLGSEACLEELDDTMSKEKKAVNQLVQQSLLSNMRRIVKRANLPQDFVPSDHFKSLTSSSTSKSLPF